MSQRTYEQILAIASKDYDYTNEFTRSVYNLLLHSTHRKKRKLRLGKITDSPMLGFLGKNRDKLEEFFLDRFYLEVMPTEYYLLKKKDLTLKDFDTAYVFEELQRDNSPRQDMPLFNQYYNQLSPSQVEEIEHTYWENLNAHIIDVAKNIIASTNAKRKVLSTLPQVI